MKILPWLTLAIVLTGLLAPVPAAADCSYRDYWDKRSRLATLIARKRAQDPAAADALAQRMRSITGAVPPGDAVGLDRACGELDDLMLEGLRQP